MATATKEQIGVVEQIGFIAGDIYAYLYKNEEASLNDLKNETGQTPAMLQMAVGWLAREHKVEISKKGAGFLVKITR